MVNPYRFYTYAYLREDKTPYYIGKGTGYRIYQKRGRPCSKPKDDTRIIFLKQNLTEEEAFKHEIYMIAVFGRKDLGTGILYNKTDGGDGVSGRIITIGSFTGKTHSEEVRKKISQSKKGKLLSEEHKRKVGDAFRGKPITEEHKRKISNSKLGKKHSEETKIKCGIKNKGKKWWSDGKKCKFMIECPGEGWVAGRKIKKDS